MLYNHQNIHVGIDKKIEELKLKHPDISRYFDVLKPFLHNIPQEFEQNWLEWINNQPISLIEYGGMSIKKVIDELHLPEKYYPQLFRNFVAFKESNFQCDFVCYRMLVCEDVISDDGK